MREYGRIARIINKLRTITYDFKDGNFFAMLFNLFDKNVNFYVDDDKVEEIIDAYITDHTHTDLIDVDKDDVLLTIETIWSSYGFSDQRFMQLLINLIPSIEYAKDEMISEITDAFLNEALNTYYNTEIKK